MFLPLLTLISGESEIEGETLGGMQFIVDGFQALGIQFTLLNVLAIILSFFVLKGLATFVRGYYNLVVRVYFVKTLRFINVDGLSTFQYKRFVTTDTGRIQNTMSTEVGRVVAAFNAYFLTLQSWVLALVYLGLAFKTNPNFAVLVIVGGLLSNVIYRQINRLTMEASAKTSSGGHQFQRQLIQFVQHFKYLKATGFLPVYGKKLKDSIAFIEEQNKKVGIYSNILIATKEPLNIAVVVLVIGVQVTFFNTQLGTTIILSLLFFYRALAYIMSIQSNWNGFLNNTGAIDNMKSFNEELHTHREKFGSIVFRGFKHSIVLSGVDFFYGDTQVIHNVGLEIKRNQTVAFVGESGSGKTTLVNLLSGLMPVDGGSIRIDNTRYRDLDIRTLQQRLGYITQDPVIFSESIYDNVTKWAPKTKENEARFWHALDQAAISKFVKSLPDAENSLLGNNGIQISGGQKQRISIARELYKDVDFLILDEATSSLDTETEKAIQENIELLKGKYTIIIVAHRLSTIKNADQIFLLNQGSLIAQGNYEKLQKQSDIFRRMTQLQVV